MKFLTQQEIYIELNHTFFENNPGIVVSFQKLIIVRNILFGVPQLQMKIRVSNIDLGNLNYFFVDGLEMEFIIEDKLNNTKFKSNILVFGTPIIESQNPGIEDGNESTILTISFIFKSSYNFLLQLTKQNCYSGTLTNILNTIANELNIKVNTNINDTSNNLNWFSYGKNYKNFLETILKYQRVQSDVLLYFLDMDGILSVKQVGKMLLETPNKTIMSSPINLNLRNEVLNKNSCETEIYYTNEVKNKNYAGLLNNITGKKNIIKNNSIIHDNNIEQQTVSFLRKNIQTELNKNQVSTLIFYGALNTNEFNINDSIYYENIRKKCLFCNEIECYICGCKASKIKILDEIKLNIAQKAKKIYNGNYVVTSKTIEISFNDYKEKLVLLNYGKNYGSLANNL